MRGAVCGATVVAGLLWAGGAFGAERCDDLFRFEPLARLGVTDLAALQDSAAENIAGTERFLVVEEYAPNRGRSNDGWSRLALIATSTTGAATPNVGGVLSIREPDAFRSPGRKIVHGPRSVKVVFEPKSPGAVAACPQGFEFVVSADGAVSAGGSVIGHVE